MLMQSEEKMITKKLGRPATGIGTLVGVRLQPAEVSRLDAWVGRQPEPRPTRQEAIRRILADALGGADAGSIPLEELNASNDE